eukprot:10372-Eustigmatos_ZCMA.PRE.1
MRTKVVKGWTGSASSTMSNHCGTDHDDQRQASIFSPAKPQCNVCVCMCGLEACVRLCACGCAVSCVDLRACVRACV